MDEKPGWHGVIVAKTYLEVHRTDDPLPKILLLDAGRSIGGTWDAARLYPGLKTNNAVSTYESSDFPLVPENYQLGNTGHIPGSVVHRYLSDFAEHFGIASLIRFSTRVQAAVLQNDGTWLVSYFSIGKNSSPEGRNGHGQFQLTAGKIAVATGLTSEPHLPTFVGQDSFEGAIFHAKELGSRATDIAAAKNIVIIGGNKSAWDACYAAALHSDTELKVVHMVIRPSGGGPSWVWRPNKVVMWWFHLSISRMSATRLFSWFDPSPLGRVHQLPRVFLRRTWLGQLVSSLFWAALDYFAYLASGYNDPFAQKLRPWNSTYWMGSSLSIHNYETEWFDLVKSGRVVVHHADVASLDDGIVHLTDGDDVEADVVVCCTGWKNESTIDFGPPAVAMEMGLPGSGLAGKEVRTKDAMLMREARQQILRQCPELLFKPLQTHRQPSDIHQGSYAGYRLNRGLELSPSVSRGFQLYHFMIPPSERMLKLRNLAFVGIHQSVHTTLVAQAQALWATAFFDGRIPSIPSTGDKQLRYETYCESEYQRLRRPKKGAGAGGKYLDLVFDTIPYVDCLLEDLGVQTKRKGTWWREIFQPYTLHDYRGIVQEWMASTC